MSNAVTFTGSATQNSENSVDVYETGSPSPPNASSWACGIQMAACGGTPWASPTQSGPSDLFWPQCSSPPPLIGSVATFPFPASGLLIPEEILLVSRGPLRSASLLRTSNSLSTSQPYIMANLAHLHLKSYLLQEDVLAYLSTLPLIDSSRLSHLITGCFDLYHHLSFYNMMSFYLSQRPQGLGNRACLVVLYDSNFTCCRTL